MTKRSKPLGFGELMEQVAQEMHRSFQSELVSHPGESGFAREEVVRRFLRKHLPEQFGVTTGFVFDSKGSVSSQIDVIIYDRSVCPVFEISGGTKFLPCEAVVCIGEVKSRISSREKLKDAIRSIQSVKSLARSQGGLKQDGEPLNHKQSHRDQIFGFVFITGRAASEQSVRTWLSEEQAAAPRHEWINLLLAYNLYLLTYCCEDGWCPNPMHAWGIGILQGVSVGELLMTFYVLLGRALSVTQVAKFPFWPYAPPISKPFSVWGFGD